MSQADDLSRAIVERLKTACDSLAPGVTISTSDLVRKALPHEEISQRLAFAILTRPPATFDGYWTQGVAVKGKFGMKRPYLWHAIHAICPHCKGSGRVRPERVGIAVAPKPSTWADFDLLDDAAKDAIPWASVPARETREDIESYIAETARRSGKDIASDPWSI